MERGLSSETVSYGGEGMQRPVIETSGGTGWSPPTFGGRGMGVLRRAQVEAHCLGEHEREESCLSNDPNHKVPPSALARLHGWTLQMTRAGPPGYSPDNKTWGSAPAVGGWFLDLNQTVSSLRLVTALFALVLTHSECRAAHRTGLFSAACTGL